MQVSDVKLRPVFYMDRCVVTISTYLTFDGNCREAFEFYRSVFGTDFRIFMTFGDAPDAEDFPGAKREEVMHCTLPIGPGVLMGSDLGDESANLTIGNNFSLSVDAEDEDQCEEWFARLSEGGLVTMPLQDTFWGSYFGQCTDRFGINWMISFERNGQ